MQDIYKYYTSFIIFNKEENRKKVKVKKKVK